MKKVSFIIISLLIGLVSYAQSGSHMKFMGIPMGISISSFQAKLAEKGVKYSPDSKYHKEAVRIYNGSFAGYVAEMYVYYDSKSKLVYRAKAVIERDSKELINNVYYELLGLLVKKYGLGNVYTLSEDEDNYSVSIEADNGRIDLYVVQMDADYYFHLKDYYTLHVDYFDDAAQSQNIKSRMDDL